MSPMLSRSRFVPLTLSFLCFFLPSLFFLLLPLRFPASAGTWGLAAAATRSAPSPAAGWPESLPFVSWGSALRRCSFSATTRSRSGWIAGTAPAYRKRSASGRRRRSCRPPPRPVCPGPRRAQSARREAARRGCYLLRFALLFSFFSQPRRGLPSAAPRGACPARSRPCPALFRTHTAARGLAEEKSDCSGRLRAPLHHHPVFFSNFCRLLAC
mmetsp:Transcript_24082/g.60659  ORF Transcript_24082/g.60659 Transcript_24082/m.60659 type:complete len:213 (-) Transcript_24082:1172-1810(-)